MKKVFLSILLIGSLMAISCKKAKDASKKAIDATEKVAKDAADKVNDVTDKVNDAVKSKIEEVKDGVVNNKLSVAKEMGIEIPSFDKKELTQNLADYLIYAKDYIAAKGNVAIISKIAPKGLEILNKGKDLLKDVDADTANKFKSIIKSIQAKMAPAK